MKKITYIAAALLAFVGCAKQEIVPQTANSNNLEVSLAVGSTKAVYDGDSHIKFEENDQMYAALASVDKPTTGNCGACRLWYKLRCFDENRQ